MMSDSETYVLEINLISAQRLMESRPRLRKVRTYALAWVNPSEKLRTRVDQVGSENPTWNDKFFFRVSPRFLASETSGVTIEIYSVGYIRDTLIGSVRFLVSNFLPSHEEDFSALDAIKSPSFIALQIHRPSGMFLGILNIAAAVNDGSDLSTISDVSAIGYRDMEQSLRRRRRHEQRRRRKMSKSSMISSESVAEALIENDMDEESSTNYSESPGSSSSPALPELSPVSSPAREWVGIVELTEKKQHSKSGGGKSCCFSRRTLHVDD